MVRWESAVIVDACRDAVHCFLKTGGGPLGKVWSFGQKNVLQSPQLLCTPG